MRIKCFSFGALGLAVGIAFGAAFTPALALPITRTLQLSRPSVSPGEAMVRERGGPGTLGPGGARRYAGVVTQSASLVKPGPVLHAVTNAYVFRNAPGCGAPVVQTSGDSLLITFPSECLDPGESVIVRFESPDSLVECGSGVWRDNGYLDVDPANCEPWPAGPGLDPRGLGTLAAFLGLAGLAIVRRRAVAAAKR